MKNEQTQRTTHENITERKKMNERSVWMILWNKFLDILENSTFRQIISVILLVIISLILTLILTYTEKATEVVFIVFKFKNYFFPKMIWSFFIVFKFKIIFDLIKQMIPDFPEIKEEPTGDTIDWIPTIEMLDHLFEFESFKRDDIEKKFKIPRNRFTELAQKLEDLGVLVRGENNARVLNNEFARSDVALILEWKTSAADLRQLIRQENECSWTTQPSKMSIIEKVKQALTQKKEEDESPSPQFTKRPIQISE